MVYLVMLYALAMASHVACASPTVDWVSHPLLSAETALVSGGGLVNGSVVSLVSGPAPGTTHPVTPQDCSGSAMFFTMPASDAPAAYDLVVKNSNGSATVPINMPEVWWWQGDGGNSSTPGGWLRLFGRSLSFSSTGKAGTDNLKEQAMVAIQSKHYSEAHHLLTQLESLEWDTPAALPTQVRLTPVSGNGAPRILTSVVQNTTMWDALFSVPSDLTAGDYTAEVSNGLSTPSTPTWVPMSTFVDPTRPAYNLVTIKAPLVWKSDVFQVDCDWEEPDLFKRPCGWVGARSSTQVDAALEKARANGGGVVYLPRGQYYVDGPLIIPEGTRLRGEGQHLVSIVFREDSLASGPRPGYIHANNSASAWAVEDLTVIITHYYRSVFYVHPTSTAWTLQRVTVRAVAWAMLADPIKGASGRGNRLADYSRTDVGEVVYLDGNSNYEIIDNGKLRLYLFHLS